MNFKVVTLIMILAVFKINTAVSAEYKPFINLGGGIVKPHSKSKSSQSGVLYNTNKKLTSSPSFKIGAGVRVNKKLELELSYNKFKSFKYKSPNKYNPYETYAIPNGTNIETNSYEEAAYQKIKYDLLELSGTYQIATFREFELGLLGSLGVGIAKSSPYTINEKYYSKTEEIVSDQPSPDSENYAVTNNQVQYRSRKSTNFAWSIGGRLSYIITDNISIDLIEFRYRDLGKSPRVSGTYPVSKGWSTQQTHSVARTRLKATSYSCGIRYYF